MIAIMIMIVIMIMITSGVEWSGYYYQVLQSIIVCVSLSFFFSSFYRGSWRSMFCPSYVAQHNGVSLYYCLPGTTQLPVS